MSQHLIIEATDLTAEFRTPDLKCKKELLTFANFRYQTSMSAGRVLRFVAPTLSAITSRGPSAVNVKMGIGLEATGRPALVRTVTRHWLEMQATVTEMKYKVHKNIN